VFLPAEEDDEIEFECKAKEEDEETEIKDKIKFKVKKIAKGEGLTVKIKYEQEIETEETETETETQYDVKFGRVVEYRKSNSVLSARATDTGNSDDDMAYEWDIDTIVQEWPLDNWQNFSAIADQGSLSTFSVATQDNTATFIFTIARDDSGDITANKMKIDFELTDFPWTADDTYVALLCTVESEREVEVEVMDDSVNDADSFVTTSRKTKDVKISFADTVDTVGFTPFGVFDWANTAEVRMGNPAEMRMGNSTNLTATESTTIQVVATSPPSESSDAIAFSFVGNAAHRAVDIYWDPSAGIAYGSDAAAFSFMGVASLGFVALLTMM
jgi:hypothetical protein